MVYFVIYLVVALVIFFPVRAVLLRDEPSAHGQIEGTKIIFLVAVLWPLALFAAVAVLIWEGALRAKGWVARRWQERFGNADSE